MAEIELKGIAHTYAKNGGEPGEGERAPEYAVESVDIRWADGETCALLGPSGCGKTTLLNIISGLVRPTSGSVLYDGKDVTDLDPRKRNIAQVFQFPVVYDTMTVYDNLAFPLRNRRLSGKRVKERVAYIAELLELEHLLKLHAGGLTAELKQLISLGRGLVREDTAAVLFDEPLTVVDGAEKGRLRRRLRQLNEEFNLTMIYVTHDQIEALTFADRVLVMSEGRILQDGSPVALFERPEHEFVGHFIGSPGMNFLECEWNGKAVALGRRVLQVSEDLQKRVNKRKRGALRMGIRPEFLKPVSEGTRNSLPLEIKDVEMLGAYISARGELDGVSLRVRLPGDEFIVAGETRWFRPEADMIRLFEKEQAI